MRPFLVEKLPMADPLCSNTVIGLSVTTGLLAIAFIGSTLWNYCYRKSQGCPYCNAHFLSEELRAHLLSCPEHLAHWTAKGSSRSLKVFAVDHPNRQLKITTA